MSDKLNWIEKSINATARMQRAEAPEGLFSKIQDQIALQSGRVISMRQIRAICAVAAMLLLVNVVIGSIYFKSKMNQQYAQQSVETDRSTNSFFSNYNIYE